MLFLIASLVPDLKDAFTQGKFWPPSPAMLALVILLLSYPMFRLLKWGSDRQTDSDSLRSHGRG